MRKHRASAQRNDHKNPYHYCLQSNIILIFIKRLNNMDITTRLADEPDFTANKTQKVNSDGHLKLGHLGAGTFTVTSKGIAQYERLKRSLEKIKGLQLESYPSHLSNVYLVKTTIDSIEKTKNVLMQLYALKALSPQGDGFLYDKLRLAVEQLTGDKFTLPIIPTNSPSCRA